MADNDDRSAYEKFSNLLSRLVRVPKREIDEQEQKYQQERDAQKRQPVRKRA